jgi:cytoskeletal protein CcmA (bactofilin family)
LWNKRPEDTPQNRQPGQQPDRTPQSQPSPVPPAPLRVEPPARRQLATIGASMHIKGDIRTEEELQVDGEVEGSLESKSVLSVGKTGKVRANIKAQEVAIFGSVRGNVEVSGKIAIRDQGSLVGDIKAAGISIDDGAYFKGSIDIVRPEPKTATTHAVKSEAKSEAKVSAGVA